MLEVEPRQHNLLTDGSLIARTERLRPVSARAHLAHLLVPNAAVGDLLDEKSFVLILDLFWAHSV